MKTVWAKDRIEIKNDELCFVLAVKKPRRNAVIKLIGRDIYNLYVNGEFVSYGPARAGHGYVREEERDITEYLTREKNIIAVDIVNYHTVSLDLVNEYPLFGAEIYFDGKAEYDTDDFSLYLMTDRIVKVERFTAQRSFVEYYKQSFDRGLFFNGQLDLFPELEAEEVERPKILDRGVHLFKNGLKTSKLIDKFYVKEVNNPRWHNDFTELLDDGKLLKTYNRAECDRIISDKLNNFEICEKEQAELTGFRYEFQRNICGKIKISVMVKEDSVIYLLFDEVLTFGRIKFNRDETIHGHAFELKKGKYNLTTFEPYGYKYIELLVKGNCEIRSVESITIENPDTGKFSFACSDKDIEAIVVSAKHVIEQNATDILTDCPSRERAGWLCDSYFSSRAEKLFTGYNLVEKNHLENYLLFKGMEKLRPDVLPECYPSETEKGSFIPNWLAWFVLELSDYVKRTGNVEITKQFKDKIEILLKFFRLYENELGLLEDLPGWVFVEWSEANKYVSGVNFPTNMLYSAMIETVGEIYSDDTLKEKARVLKEKIWNMAFNGEFYADNATRVNGKITVGTHCSEIGQYYAIFFGIADEKRDQPFIKKMTEEFGMQRDEKTVYPDICKANMFIGNYLRFEILMKYGKYEKLVKECKDFLLIMAKNNSSLWENRIISPDLNYNIPGSCCHGFASVSAVYLVRALTGYEGYDTQKKEIYMGKDFLDVDCKISIPVENGVFSIENKRGINSLVLPKGYAVKYVD